MFDLFGDAKGLISFSAVKIDNDVFRIHYKGTLILLVVFSILITGSQYIGDPIDCMVDEIPHDVMDSYCWIYSTFTVPNQLKGRLGKDVIQPGVAAHVPGEDEVKYHKYYQWVCFVLIFQALLFYIPHYLWKIWESNRVRNLAESLKGPIFDVSEVDDKIQTVVKYFEWKKNCHKPYFYLFFVCEILNFINVVGQMFFMNYFLDGEFSTYGWDVFQFTGLDPEVRDDPMSRVFPKITKCTFHKYGPSGTVQIFDGLCVLPLNIVNEKIYVFLWFWFVLLAVISGLAILYRIAIIMVPSLRRYRLASSSKLADKEQIKLISNRYDVGDWFLLSQLGINMDPIVSKALIEQLAEHAK